MNGPSSVAHEVTLSMTGIHKRFPGVQALSDVNFEARSGEVHALVGENGSGKSTLLKILAGAYRRDAGEVAVRGELMQGGDPREAQRFGVGVVYQDLQLVPDLSVAENLFIGRLPKRGRLVIDRARLSREAAGILADLEADLDPERPVRGLSVGQQQLVEIATVYARKPSIIALDEPTSSLTDHEVAALFRTVRRLRDRGLSIIYVSHRLSEVREIADRVTVLRDGKVTASRDIANLSQAEMIRLMVGREISELFPKRQVPIGDVVLAVEGLTRRGLFKDVSFSVRSGEIVGLAGLVGAGRTEVAQCIFGLTPPDGGHVRVRGREVRCRSARDAIGSGIAYLPEDRKGEGLIPGMSVAENLSVAVLQRLAIVGVLRPRLQRDLARDYVERLQIRPPDPRREVMTLSGGNQQKVVIGKWLATEPAVLILDEPTRGVDIGAKAEIHRLIGELVARGVAIVLISSELPEVLSVSDRVIVMDDGEITAELSHDEATEERVMLAATSVERARPSA